LLPPLDLFPERHDLEPQGEPSGGEQLGGGTVRKENRQVGNSQAGGGTVRKENRQEGNS